ncbi:enoyl-CoA hydratase-related protein [Shewanella khirikhana]|uniref:Hydroxycinnamoyl-CoA hydratase-lyase n=1 Tax=Shewanella khirikhana TaxID=1965282 RepID=A0ABN5TRF6_9GAMM|nr:enoyl-CoA hydratase-related protein [Shewanella khirikhana]AZQ10067.1 Hydroxycinnamoyl-CoA hydratase-lyase [Shewanella khirikhana]
MTTMTSIAELSASFSAVRCELKGKVGYLILNRPEVHNAFDEVMISEMTQAINAFAHESDCAVMVLKSDGKHFSAGADLNWMRKQAAMDFDANLKDARELANLMDTLDRFPKPSIALVNGAAYGGALGLICCCDIAISSHKASFCLSEVKLGLIPAVISPYVVRAMGPRQSRRYMLTAERFDASMALALGVVHEIADDLDAAAAPIIQNLLSGSPQALGWCKSLIARLQSGVIDEHTRDYTSERIARIRVSGEGQEGLNAFFDKRSPAWVNDTGSKD